MDPIASVGLLSGSWARGPELPLVPAEWPSLSDFEAGDGIWLSAVTDGEDGKSQQLDRALLPLRVDGRLDGVIYLEWSGSRRSEEYDLHFLEPIARVCSISLANFRLRSELLVRAAAQRALNHRLGTLDELTRMAKRPVRSRNWPTEP